MRIYAEKLAAHLSNSLLPVYCISGDEPLLVQECSDLVRTAARNAGCNEREIIDAGVTRFNWESIRFFCYFFGYLCIYSFICILGNFDVY